MAIRVDLHPVSKVGRCGGNRLCSSQEVLVIQVGNAKINICERCWRELARRRRVALGTFANGEPVTSESTCNCS
jgi:hypothetical protein